MNRLSTALLATALAAAFTGCGILAGFGGPGPVREAPGPGKTLVVATRAEPPSLSPKPFRALGLTADLSARMFNAGLVIRNDRGRPVPYLAEELPQFSTNTWRLFPNGTMETIYRLKTGAVWQDGRPLTADDFVFSYEVYSDPVFATGGSPPISLIDQVSAPDRRTLVIHWRQTFADADSLQAGTGGTSSTAFPPLPRHLLGPQRSAQEPEAFMASSFWTQGYVGAGPYRLDKWESGVFLEGLAFDGDVFGKPKINRIRELFIGDSNTVVANLLAGEVQLTTGDSIRHDQGKVVEWQWKSRGSVLYFPNLYRLVQFQQRPEYASTLAFTDPRVRQALSYGVDFSALSEALFGGATFPASGPIKPTASYYLELERTVRHYPLNPLRSGQLMVAAGFAAGPDGVWVSQRPGFGRMSFELTVLAAPDNDNEMHILANAWRKLGFDVKEADWAPALGPDSQLRNTFSGLSATSALPGEIAFASYRNDRVPTAANRWSGTNRGGWPGTAAYDRLVDTWETSLDATERTQAAIRMNQILNEDSAVINLYWKLNAQAVASGVVGPRLTDPNGTAEWNIQDWAYS